MDSLLGAVAADVLALLPPRSLAACRCVCKAWRAVVDAGRLLRADLLPLSVGGIFTNMMHELVFAQFSSSGDPRRGARSPATSFD
ncbi:uncharacterized protein C2845_PM04G01270 [Panicum miliaceum]|uniref:F-box domain-containing protein n=1 Tax=Panicum miliaceum TaxID=4540 RepID=A0A3L6QPN7_PANMI|nr:uncharacterized protein C2845_PM04G01270 [Panicum miliaceum]